MYSAHDALPRSFLVVFYMLRFSLHAITRKLFTMSTNTFFTVSDIAKAKITGKTTQTVRRDLKKRQASTQVNNRAICVELSELLRIYEPHELDFTALRGEGNDNTQTESRQAVVTKNIADENNNKNDSATKIQVLEEKLNSTDKQIVMLENQVTREREIVEDLKDALQRSQETQSKTTLLLTHYTQQGENEISNVVKTLEARLAAQQHVVSENNALRKILTVFKTGSIAFIILGLLGVGLYSQNVLAFFK